MNLRNGETGIEPARSERFFQRDSYWYYSTREGVDIGPYDTRTGAARGCAQFIDYMAMRGSAFSATLEQYSNHAA